MAQWVNHLWNNIFVNPPPLPLLCEISGPLHLAQPSLTAGRQADKIQVNFKIFKVWGLTLSVSKTKLLVAGVADMALQLSGSTVEVMNKCLNIWGLL